MATPKASKLVQKTIYKEKGPIPPKPRTAIPKGTLPTPARKSPKTNRGKKAI